MRAGTLDRLITIQSRATASVDDFGTPSEAWSDVADLRAQVVQGGTEEFLRSYGEAEQTAYIFRTRYLSSVTVEHRVAHDGRHFNIREVKEIGRGKGLEIRCVEVRQ